MKRTKVEYGDMRGTGHLSAEERSALRKGRAERRALADATPAPMPPPLHTRRRPPASE